MIFITSVLAAPPTDPAELADAAVEAVATIARCKESADCAAGRDGLAKAFLVVALAGAIVDGESDPTSAANARQLDPDLAASWKDLLSSEGTPESWVTAWGSPTAKEPLPPPRPSPPRPSRAHGRFGYGGGAPMDFSVRTGQDLDINPPALGDQVVDLTLQAVTKPIAITTELNLTRTPFFFRNTEPIGPSIEETREVKGHTVSASFYTGIGPRWGNERVEFQTTLGPVLGTSSFPTRLFNKVLDIGRIPPPSPWYVGVAADLRVRWAFSDRFAMQSETRGGAGWVLTPTRYLRPERRMFDDPAQGSTKTTRLGVGTRLEAQVRITRSVWMGVGGDLATPGQRHPTAWKRIPRVGGHLSIRWRDLQ